MMHSLAWDQAADMMQSRTPTLGEKQNYINAYDISSVGVTAQVTRVQNATRVGLVVYRCLKLLYIV